MRLALDKRYSLAEIARLIGASLDADAPDLELSHLASIEAAGIGDLSFIANPSYSKYLATTQASAVILSQSLNLEARIPCLTVRDSRAALAKLLSLVKSERAPAGIDASAVIAADANIAKSAYLGPNVVIGSGCVVGANTRIHANVVLYPGTKIGDECVVHSGTVIGTPGFGYAKDADGLWQHLAHHGGVSIGSRVEIGANTCIDRGLFEDTVIESNVIIDNQVQIGHNVSIGEGTAIAGCTGIAGSTKIGRNCLIGGAATIAGHIEIADNVNLTGSAAVSKSILEAGTYSSGIPVQPSAKWQRDVVRFRNLSKLSERVKKLEERNPENIELDTI